MSTTSAVAGIVTRLIECGIGVAILMGKADVRAIAWFWVLTGALIVALLLIGGVGLLAREVD